MTMMTTAEIRATMKKGHFTTMLIIGWVVSIETWARFFNVKDRVEFKGLGLFSWILLFACAFFTIWDFLLELQVRAIERREGNNRNKKKKQRTH